MFQKYFLKKYLPLQSEQAFQSDEYKCEQISGKVLTIFSCKFVENRWERGHLKIKKLNRMKFNKLEEA